MAVVGSKITVGVSAPAGTPPLGGVPVAVSPQVFLTPDMTGAPTSTVTSNSLGVITCYALPGVYTFSPPPGSATIPPQTVDETLGGSVDDTTVASLTALINARSGHLTDGGSTVQWTPGTFTAPDTVWGYQGANYVRIVSGTDTVWTRSHWTLLGADPQVAAGGELAATVLATTWSGTVGFTTPVDVTGFTVAPVIPASGRGIYVDFFACVAHSVANGIISVILYDVTAGARAVDSTGATCGAYNTTCTKASAGFLMSGRWRLAPAAGPRSYKIQVLIGSSGGTVSVFGRSDTFESGLTVTAR